MRLAKFLAGAGVASRRASEEIVREGRVTVAGEVITDPAYDVSGESDGAIRVDGQPVVAPLAEGLLVYALNKPVGVVSSASDPQGRPTVVSLVPAETRLYPVGRLDLDSSGLILLTNDGELAHLLTHPSFEVEKTYRAVVGQGPVRDTSLRRLRAGVRLEDGMTAPARVRRLDSDTLELTIHEGRKRQVRRMCDHVGHPVISLQRVAIGPLGLGRLKPGAHRIVTAAEVQALRRAAGSVS
jgi:23S rRNA pseudouridine2605 synthase